jgi:uncharacterized coiled-coil DUF342 family protein
MAAVAEAPAAEAPVATPAATKPVKPDEDQFKKDLLAAEKVHKVAMDKYNAIRSKVDSVAPKGGKDAPQNPTQKRRQELITEANEIRQKQGGAKNARTAKMDQIKRLDEQLRSRLQEQKASRAKVSFKSVEELDAKIADLDAQVSTGNMKIVDEKKALAEISMLRKTRKNFSQFDEQQKQIDELRSKIKEIKDSMESPEQKELSERYTVIQTELDTIKAEQDEIYKNLSSLRDERSRLQAEQQQTWAKIKEIKDEYYQGRKAFQAHEREQREKAAERRRLEREKSIKERKKAEAERLLAEASDPAFLEEIRRAHSLLRFLDPTYQGGEKAPLQANSGLGAEATRKIEDHEIKGMKLVRKEDRDDEFMPSTKSGRKGKKKDPATAAANSNKYSCPPSVMADCASMNIDPPMSQADVPAVVDKVKAKLAHWKENQKEQTQKNIEKAKKEIERLEREESGDAPPQKSDSPKNAAVDAPDAPAAADPVEEATTELNDASLEENKENEPVAVAA